MGELHVETADFTATVDANPPTLSVVLSGTADMTVAEVLDEFLAKVHARAVTDQVTEVLVDIKALEFMNSSCLRAAAAWLLRLKIPDATPPYRVTFVSCSQVRWQARALPALKYMADDLVSVVHTDGPPPPRRRSRGNGEADPA